MEPIPRCHSAVATQPLDSSGPTEGAWLRRVGGLPVLGRWWLDSALPTPPLGRWSFAGAEPWAVLRSFGSRHELEVVRAARPDGPGPGRHVLAGPALEVLASLQPPPPACPVDVPFTGGAILVLGYGLGARLDRVRGLHANGAELPDLCALFVDRLYAFDHLEGRLWAVGCGFGASPARAEARARHAAREQAALPEGSLPSVRPGPPLRSPASPAADAALHAKSVGEVRERIEAGDLYQACLTRRLDRPAPADPWSLYARLRRANPAPFGAYLELPDGVVLGSSPERFLRVTSGGWAESRPIKGTRPRGESPGEDRRLRAELAASPKDRAENLMIVDLVRNDLGRVCEVGSVHVPELMAIESYTTLFQMVSTVRGRLAPGSCALDAVAAAFPPGSMTGAPKLAAMELLARLEPEPRGFYAGALGYLDVAGGCDLSVVIRTAFLRGGRLFFHTGGGIVADSQAEEEWQESEDKVRVLLEALS